MQFGLMIKIRVGQSSGHTILEGLIRSFVSLDQGLAESQTFFARPNRGLIFDAFQIDQRRDLEIIRAWILRQAPPQTESRSPLEQNSSRQRLTRAHNASRPHRGPRPIVRFQQRLIR